MRVCIVPTYQGADQGDGGIRRVVEAQQRYLPEVGIHVTDTPGDADLIACHGTSLVEQAGVPLVAHNHGLMWREYEFGAWGDDVNKHCIELMARAQSVTAPSRWVANAISRGMLIRPEVVYHGVDADEWAHSYDHLGYVLWNKARADQVSDPDDMNRLAALLPDIPFVATFGERAQNVILTGPRSYTDMRPIVQKAGVYLATARETFGIGTLEALATGVPVAGWRYGGQEEIVIEGETGYLAEWGDYEGLAVAVRRCLADRARLSRHAVEDARARWGWADKIAQYAALYRDVLARWTAPRPKVSVVLTCHNLDRYLNDAVDSVLAQTMRDWELIIVDDDSTDRTAELSKALVKYDKRIRYEPTPSNLKLSGARNYGWQLATGKYIIFLDADDMLDRGALDTLSLALDRDTSIHIAYGHLDTVNDRGEDRKRNPWPPDRFDWRQQLAHLNQLPYAALLRREVLERSGGYRARDWRAEDAALWCRLTSFGFRAEKVTEDATLIYRLRGDSKSRGEPGDGDWTAWYPWRLAASGPEGLQAIQEKKQPNPALVPFGAQGTPPLPLRAWPVPHHQHPAVSVIIPVGPGHEKYLIDALDSVQAQTCGAWECIVINDTGERIELPGHPWARVWEINRIDGDTVRRMGAGGARNWGLRHARAPLVLVLDADDMLTPRALESMLRAYVANQGGYVYSDWASLEDETRWDGEADWHHTPEYSEDMWFQGFQHPVTCLIETEHARAAQFDEELPAWEDWDFYLRLLVKGVCPAKVAEPLLIYRLASGTRRNAAKANEERLLATIRQRYEKYITGEEQVMGCCNGNTVALNAARTALDDMLGPLAEELAFAPPPVEAGVVRMEFIGDSLGAQTWFSKDRQRRYEGGRDPRARFIDAAPEDVEHLISLGVWRVVQLPREEPELILAGVAVEEPREQRQRVKKSGR